MKYKKTLLIFFALSFIFSLFGCAKKESSFSSLKGENGEIIFYDSVFTEENATEIPYGYIDYSHASDGYIAVKCTSDKALKFQLKYETRETYTYDIIADGTVNIYPLNFGSGAYTLKLRENIEDNNYSEPWSDILEADIENEFAPFIRPNQYVNYNKYSECVKLAEELLSDCDNDLDAASIVYDYIINNISYDYEKAENVKSGYLPCPDSTLSEKKGICLDYASLAAAMLRSRDIPCQLITGYFTEDCIYHAWNRIYIEGEGWLTVEIKVSGDSWKRIDATMAATGESSDILEDGSLYTEKSIY